MEHFFGFSMSVVLNCVNMYNKWEPMLQLKSQLRHMPLGRLNATPR
jgi:hypothetical protein